MPELMRIDAQPLQAGSNGALLPGRSSIWYEYEVGGTSHQGERIKMRLHFWNGRAGSFMDYCNFSIHRKHEIVNWPLGERCPAPLGAGGAIGEPGFEFDNPDAPIGGKTHDGVLERGLEVYVRVYNTSDLLFEYDLNVAISDAAPA